MLKVVVIIQARMGSTRLPGKVMKQIAGKTVLEHVVDRIRQSKLVNEVVIATTIKDDDLAIVKESERLGVSCFRGSEEDVLSRYYYAAKESNAEIVVRITSDCPLIDPAVLDEMLVKFIGLYERREVDYLSNTLQRTFPRGLDAEIFPFEILEKIFNEAKQDYEREHVTPYIYQNPDQFKLVGFKNHHDYSDYRLTLDTEEDLMVITKIYENLCVDDKIVYQDEVIKFMENNPDIKAINESIKQKELG
ncbi:spore coat polysaccharide biosynthesis protein SpsF [Alkaliphilus hydrothermalis]|uniref:Spore coat polysaccharide biosynthesis protein SpsF n=2 Tax=Alkaliphilus hydrothermalis TaxID=1482730 RepID=A0ABS2NQY9_9FIRM|nr:glycosyltransferase family protein [Alkaliphilus hydrothermalis]MBM7615378.1 spore coat polysaccharide biosynthesis protein SpsF [Alkaliphilus hydrothermalis]